MEISKNKYSLIIINFNFNIKFYYYLRLKLFLLIFICYKILAIMGVGNSKGDYGQ